MTGEPAPAPAEAEVYAFADLVLDVGDRTLRRGSETLALAPKSFDLLVALVRRGGRLATKDELLDEVWSDATVTEASLAQAVSQLRRALGDDGERIATVPKAGYRFAAAVRREGLPESAPPAAVVPAVARTGRNAWIAGAVVVLAALVFLIWRPRTGGRPATATKRAVASPAEAQQWQDARAAMEEYRWDDAIRALDTLFGRLPDHLEIGLDLVSAYVAAGRSEEERRPAG